MPTADLVAAAAVPLGFAVAGLAMRPAVRASGLGICHPALAWLALEATFFGVGAFALAAGSEAAGPALYLAACVVAAALGTLVAHRLFGGRAGRPALPATPLLPSAETGLRGLVPAIVAVASLAILLPTLVTSGLALLTADPTASRSELVGIPVQLVRVALPGLAAVVLLELFGGRPALGRPLVSWATITGLVVLSILLGSRYLVVELLATMVIAWLLSGRRIDLRLAITASFVAVAGFVVIGVARAPTDFANSPVVTAAERTASRLFLVQPRTLAALQETIPAEQPYFLGLTWARRLGPLFGRSDIPNLGYWIYPRVVTDQQTTAGYAAPGLLGEAWANFGPAGIGLFVLLGGAMERLGVLVAARRRRIIDIVAAALAILFVARMHALGLLGAGLLLGLVLLWRLLAGSWGPGREPRQEPRPDPRPGPPEDSPSSIGA